jgi:hypothetical protein
MKNNFLYSAMAVILILSGVACDDFIEKDLSHKQVIILTPLDNAVSSSYTQTFKWEDLKGASGYHLQIVKPSFTNLQLFITDTTVHSTQFSFTFKPGTYQWRIKGVNGSSSTNYQTYTITIDSTNDLTNQHVLLLSPGNNEYVSDLTQTFTWSYMAPASNYVFQAFSSSNSPIAGSLQSVTTNYASFTFPSQGTYKWRVYAQNPTSSTVASEFIVNIDTLSPNSPIVISPVNDTNLIVNPVSLKWFSVTGASSYQVQVSDNPSFATPTDTVTTNTSYNFNAALGIIYYWRVKSIDNAANESVYTNAMKFKRN